MSTEVETAQKNALVSCVGLLTLALPLDVLPGMAVKHGVHAVWVVVPFSLLAAAGLVNTVFALHRLRGAKCLHG